MVDEDEAINNLHSNSADHNPNILISNRRCFDKETEKEDVIIRNKNFKALSYFILSTEKDKKENKDKEMKRKVLKELTNAYENLVDFKEFLNFSTMMEPTFKFLKNYIYDFNEHPDETMETEKKKKEEMCLKKKVLRFSNSIKDFEKRINSQKNICNQNKLIFTELQNLKNIGFLAYPEMKDVFLKAENKKDIQLAFRKTKLKNDSETNKEEKKDFLNFILHHYFISKFNDLIKTSKYDFNLEVTNFGNEETKPTFELKNKFYEDFTSKYEIVVEAILNLETHKNPIILNHKHISQIIKEGLKLNPEIERRYNIERYLIFYHLYFLYKFAKLEIRKLLSLQKEKENCFNYKGLSFTFNLSKNNIIISVNYFQHYHFQLIITKMTKEEYNELYSKQIAGPVDEKMKKFFKNLF
ncbi:MAG: hypothetical protein MJ252_16210, partial [archaeon]|nr:hypothetical protein [archaeon]